MTRIPSGTAKTNPTASAQPVQARKDEAPPPKAGTKSPAADRFVGETAGRTPAKADPLSDLADIRERRQAAKAGAAQAVEGQTLDRDQRLERARQMIVQSFERDFVPSPEFQDTFEKATWAEVRDQVIADAKMFGNDADFEDAEGANGSIIFLGRVLGLYTEVEVRPDGTVLKPYFEID